MTAVNSFSSLWRSYFRIAIIFAIASGVLSCNKYLDKKRNNSVLTPQTLDDLQALLDDALKMNQVVTPGYGQASTDDYFLLKDTYDGRPSEQQSAYTFKPFNYSNGNNDWSFCYTPVFNANYCLDQIQEIPRTSQNGSKWDNVQGSSLFFRSYFFLMAAWNHAKAYDESTATTDLGIALRVASDFNVPSVRASVKETYEKIITDAKESALFLPDLPIHPYRPSKCAAYGLLARTYLSMRIYDSALKYSNLALNIKSTLINYNGDADFLGAAAAFPLKIFNKETIFYTEMNLLIGIISTSRAKIDTILYSKFTSNDIRQKAYFAPNAGYFNFKGSYVQGSNYFTGIATDELYLIRAECTARRKDGDFKDAAMNDLNTLLKNRFANPFTPLTATTLQNALDIILLERRKELLFRGIRWSDIKRLNKEGYNITPTRLINGQMIILSPNSNLYALPLPTDVVNISGMPQNPL